MLSIGQQQEKYMRSLQGKRVLVGITGGIAAYKTCSLIRLLAKEGAIVDAVMTPHATEFITPLTISSLTGKEPGIGQFEPGIKHIGYAKNADLIVVAPATANTIAKAAHGIADNLLTSVLLAAKCPIIMAPAMNEGMWSNAATQCNIKILRERGFIIAGPGVGSQACGDTGAGRMLEPEEILDTAVAAANPPKDGRLFVITAGPTEEPLDPVRCLTNRSSGKMGYALAEAALAAGFRVKLISGPVALKAPAGAELIKVKTAAEMLDASWTAAKQASCFIGCAAVADFRPLKVAPNKIKKEDGEETVKLVMTKNPDIIASVASLGGPYVVGFAAETQNVLGYARSKLKAKKLNMIVANDVSRTDAGFGSDNNCVTVIDDSGCEDALPLMSKREIADAIIARIAEKIKPAEA